MKKVLFVMLSAAVVMFASCKDDDKDDKNKKGSGSEITTKGGSMTYNGVTYELTDAVQHNNGKIYNGSEVPNNYIEIMFHKLRTVEVEGKTIYDTLHLIQVGLFSSSTSLQAGTYTKNNNAADFTYLNTWAWAGYYYNNDGQVFQTSSKFSGDVVVKKEGEAYNISINWIDENNKPFTVTYVGSIPEGNIPRFN